MKCDCFATGMIIVNKISITLFAGYVKSALSKKTNECFIIYYFFHLITKNNTCRIFCQRYLEVPIEVAFLFRWTLRLYAI